MLILPSLEYNGHLPPLVLPSLRTAFPLAFHASSGVNHPRLGLLHAASGVNKPRLGLIHGASGVNKPCLGLIHASSGVNKPRLGQLHAASGVNQPCLGQLNAASGVNQPRLGQLHDASAPEGISGLSFDSPFLSPLLLFFCLVLLLFLSCHFSANGPFS